MCLAIPMQVLEIEGLAARCTAKGVERTANLALLMDDLPAVGDFVQISMGRAIRKVSEEEAAQTWELFDEILAAEDGAA